MAWIQTESGPFDFERCGPADFNINTIAHALSNLCRWNGHTRRFYSVAEHSVLLARYIMNNYEGSSIISSRASHALLHDASEAFIGDVTRPLKHLMGPIYTDLESSISSKIYERYCLHPTAEDKATVKWADDQICIDERRMLLPPLEKEEAWSVQGDGLGVDIFCWEPHIARSKFLETWHEIGRMFP